MKLLLLLMPVLMVAAMLQVGERIEPRTLADQFDVNHTIGSEALWAIGWDRETTQMLNDYFKTHPMKACAMLVDVSQVPSGIFSIFVKPRMQRYSHPILLSFDTAFNLSLPYEEGSITLMWIKDGRISRIAYAPDDAALAQLITSNR